MPILEVKNIARSFGGLKAVDRVSFSVEGGQIKAIIGPNGAGKTTLFNLIAGILEPHGGEVFFKGESIYGLPPHKIAQKGIFRTFQNVQLFSRMTVLENILVGHHRKMQASFFHAAFGVPALHREEKRAVKKVTAIAEMLNLTKHLHIQTSQLDFGTQRLVELARALAGEPELLLLDEPAAGLNIHETSQLASFIRQIRTSGITIVLIEHDMSLVMDVSDEIVVLSYGKKIAEGIPSEIQKNPEVIAVYLGNENA
ncbi:MAG: ABC transporter ATP-binding protein [Spirochaetes bacterium]|nr:ABC transporter ATP-binding protein [Spirochaetota bacterium]